GVQTCALPIYCYPSGLIITGFGASGITIRYALNENADGISGGPAVTIKIRKASDNSLVRTVNFTAPDAHTRAGVQTYTWDKKDDGANPVPIGSYYFEVFTQDDGYAAWTRIDSDNTFNNFE